MVVAERPVGVVVVTRIIPRVALPPDDCIDARSAVGTTIAFRVVFWAVVVVPRSETPRPTVVRTGAVARVCVVRFDDVVRADWNEVVFSRPAIDVDVPRPVFPRTVVF